MSKTHHKRRVRKKRSKSTFSLHSPKGQVNLLPRSAEAKGLSIAKAQLYLTVKASDYQIKSVFDTPTNLKELLNQVDLREAQEAKVIRYFLGLHWNLICSDIKGGS